MGWPRIESVNDSGIGERLDRIERLLTDGVRALNLRLDSAEPVLRLFTDGLETYRGRLLHESRLGRIRQVVLGTLGPEIGFPHRKILDFLLGECDFAKDDFKEVHFSRIVQQCHVAKGKAQGYLSLLEQKGFLVKRDDGYRMFFRIRS